MPTDHFTKIDHFGYFASIPLGILRIPMPKPPKKTIGTCAICHRELIAGPSVNAHHLVPKTYKGTETIHIHTICHSKIHSLFTEQELYQHYHTVERLRAHPEMEKFIRWVSKKEAEFRSRNHTAKSKGVRR